MLSSRRHSHALIRNGITIASQLATHIRSRHSYKLSSTQLCKTIAIAKQVFICHVSQTGSQLQLQLHGKIFCSPAMISIGLSLWHFAKNQKYYPLIFNVNCFTNPPTFCIIQYTYLLPYNIVQHLLPCNQEFFEHM